MKLFFSLEKKHSLSLFILSLSLILFHILPHFIFWLVFLFLILFATYFISIRFAYFFIILICFSYFSYRQKSLFFTPFPCSSIRVIEGQLLTDPTYLSSHKVMMKVKLIGVKSIKGQQGESDGIVSCFYTDSKNTLPTESLFWGDSLCFEGKFSSKGSPCFFAKKWFYSKEDYQGGLCSLFFSFRGDILKWVRGQSRQGKKWFSSFFPALFLGMGSPEKKDISTIFRESGCAHIIALSGFHAGLIAFIVIFILSKVFGKTIGRVFSLLFLLLFLLIVGFKPSLVRAVIMFIFYTVESLRLKRVKSLSLLLLSYICSALIFPLSVLDYGSQLSYLALGGILITSPKVYQILSPYIHPLLLGPLAVSLGAQLWTISLVSLLFSQWYPIGFIASLILTPLITIYLYGGLLFIFLPPWGGLKDFLSFGLEKIEVLIFFIGEQARNFPSIHFNTPLIPFLCSLFAVLLFQFYRPGRVCERRSIQFKL